jgi:hypothetical protein
LDGTLTSFFAAQPVLERPGGGSTLVATEDLFAAANEMNGAIKIVHEIDESVLREFGRESRARLWPTSAALGGIVGHDILMPMSGRFAPLTQLLAVGCMEALPPRPIELIPQS